MTTPATFATDTDAPTQRDSRCPIFLRLPLGVEGTAVADLRVGEGATVRTGSDAKAYTVIRRTRTTATLRMDKQVLINGPKSGEPDALQFHVGGFCAHVTGTQRWSCEPDPEGRVITARLTKKGWMADGRPVSAGRHPFYDYNF